MFVMEQEMATHSSVLAWRIPWKGEPGGLHSMGSQRVGHDWVSKHMYLCTFCTFTCCIHAHVLVCSGVLCESRSLKTIEGLMGPPFTFKIPEVYRRCTIARLFLNLCYYKDIFVDIHELTQTETVLKLDLFISGKAMSSQSLRPLGPWDSPDAGSCFRGCCPSEVTVVASSTGARAPERQPRRQSALGCKSLEFLYRRNQQGFHQKEGQVSA